MSKIKTKSEIYNEMKEVFRNIIDDSGWAPKRKLEDIKIEIGETPEFFESFGVVRNIDKITFGKWIDDVQPKLVGNHFWDFLIIRETFSLFIDQELLFGEQKQLISYFLNFLALSYYQASDAVSTWDVKLFPIQARVLHPIDNKYEKEKDFFIKINSINQIISKGISYKMIYNTFTSFIEDIPQADIDPNEILEDFRRYLSSDPSEIAAPIRLKENTTKVLQQLIEQGSNTSSADIARKLGVNQSTVARQISKINTKFYAKWRLERNFMKIGLFSYVLLIRSTKENQNNLDTVCEEIFQIDYFYQVFQGENENFSYLYATIHCPHFVANDKLPRKLNTLKNKGLITNFEIKEIKARITRTTVVKDVFQPLTENFRKLLNNEIECKKIILWNSSSLNKERKIIDEKEKDLFKFISVVISKSISKYGLYGLHYAEAQKFLREKNIDIENISESIAFLSKLQNLGYEQEIIDYKIVISITGYRSADILIGKITCDPKEKKSQELLERISCFGSSADLELLDGFLIIIMGPSYKHPITNLLLETISDYDFEFEFFSAKQKKFRSVDYSKLYDFQSKKWMLK